MESLGPELSRPASCLKVRPQQCSSLSGPQDLSRTWKTPVSFLFLQKTRCWKMSTQAVQVRHFFTGHGRAPPHTDTPGQPPFWTSGHQGHLTLHSAVMLRLVLAALTLGNKCSEPLPTPKGLHPNLPVLLFQKFGLGLG